MVILFILGIIIVLFASGWFVYEIGHMTGYLQGREDQLKNLLDMDLIKNKDEDLPEEFRGERETPWCD